jgi:hypothetical protein
MSVAEEFHLKKTAKSMPVETSDRDATQLDFKVLVERKAVFSNQSTPPQLFITSNLKNPLGGFQKASKSRTARRS